MKNDILNQFRGQLCSNMCGLFMAYLIHLYIYIYIFKNKYRSEAPPTIPWNFFMTHKEISWLFMSFWIGKSACCIKVHEIFMYSCQTQMMTRREEEKENAQWQQEAVKLAIDSRHSIVDYKIPSRLN